MEQRKKIAVLLGYYEHDIYCGIMRYARQLDWIIYRPMIYNSSDIESLLSYADGIITLHANRAEIIDTIKKSKRPVVDIDRDIGLPVQRVYTDDIAAGEMVADFFIQLGISNFGFVDLYRGNTHTADRSKGFLSTAKSFGKSAKLYTVTKQMADYSNWLKNELFAKISFPIGIMCNSDFEADIIIDYCQKANIAVPEDVSIIGIKSEDVIAESASITISCLDANCIELGYQAAKELDKLLKGEETIQGPRTTLVNPLKVIERQSTRSSLLDHHELKKAINFMNQNFQRLITIENVVNATEISHRQLNKLCQKRFGKSLQKILVNIRLEFAKDLLLKNEKSKQEIAKLAGFTNSRQMNIVFNRHLGMPPKEFQKANLS